MRLRQRLLSPAQLPRTAERPRPGGPRGTGGLRGMGAEHYDGVADQQIIVSYLPVVTPFSELIDHLYESMFERHPYLRGLFPESMDFQRAHLEQMFRYLIDHLHRPDEVLERCRQLGRDHRKLGVRPVHYQVFEEALAEALRRRAGRHWSEDLEWAWLRMLRFAVAAMVEGAETALAEPASWQATVVGHQLRRPDLAVLRVSPAEPYPYQAGQFATLQSPLLPHAWRAYTPARPPRPDGELEFHIRLTGPGGVSEVLVGHTRVGDTLRLGPAQGTMVLDESARDLLIVAGGTGWATARALLEELSTRRAPGRTVHLFLGARSREELYDAAALADLENRCHWLRVVPVIEDEAVDSLADAVARHGDWSGHLAYLSGPPGMVAEVERRLAELRLPPEEIRRDPVARTAQSAELVAAGYHE
ncbi:flavohemoprotein [Streptomyces palmae]|uniref:nitric oxide dioxygenase n=2 Tax=Streptomyces palmae TaxID=1701085 RepID=A0A4Z0H0J7_9ACTN|nr:flavohemoprotein [Streptomyces palmae]